MDPTEAANHYLYLDATAPIGVAASFAREYEDKASEDEFDAFLSALDLSAGV